MSGELQFDDNLMNEFIRAHSPNVIHEVAISCTCAPEDTYAGMANDGKERRVQPFCNRCGGTGWLYRDPKVIKGIVTSIRQQRNIIDVGITQPGDMVFCPQLFSDTCEGDPRKIGTWDKITATWEQPTDGGQVIVRGAATKDDNVLLSSDLENTEDRLWYEPASAIWCEDENGVVYKENGDFILGPGKVIKWVGKSPARGTVYTLKYNAYFSWIVFNPPQARIDKDGKDLGPVVMLRKHHVVFINESPKIKDVDRLSLLSRVKC